MNLVQISSHEKIGSNGAILAYKASQTNSQTQPHVILQPKFNGRYDHV
jgi:hypothetical protein